MNSRDLKNFEYIMSLSDDDFDEWLYTITDGDVNYAIELIQLRREELAMEELKLTDNVEDFTDAMTVINRIKAMK